MTIAPQDRVLDWQPSTHADANARHRLAGLDCYSVGSARPSIRRTLPSTSTKDPRVPAQGSGSPTSSPPPRGRSSR